MPCSVDTPERPTFFLREMKEEWIWGMGEEGGLGEVDEGETSVRMYCVRED